MEEFDFVSFMGGLYVGIFLIGLLSFLMSHDKIQRDKIALVTVIGMTASTAFMQIFRT